MKNNSENTKTIPYTKSFNINPLNQNARERIRNSIIYGADEKTILLAGIVDNGLYERKLLIEKSNDFLKKLLNACININNGLCHGKMYQGFRHTWPGEGLGPINSKDLSPNHFYISEHELVLKNFKNTEWENYNKIIPDTNYAGPADRSELAARKQEEEDGMFERLESYKDDRGNSVLVEDDKSLKLFSDEAYEERRKKLLKKYKIIPKISESFRIPTESENAF